MKQPGLINIDVTGLCNKTCNYCPRSEGYPNEKEYMDWKLFRKFVQDLDDYRGIICFTGRGENSLHPDFGLLVKLLHHPNRKYKTRIISNGYRLEKRLHYFEEFDYLIINSYDSEEEMEKRKKIIPRAKHRYWNQNMKPEDWGQTEVIVSNRSDIYNRIATDTSEIDTPCTFPSVKIWVHWDGTIQKCCNDWTNTEIFGNIKTDNILDVWQSKAFKELQDNLLQGNRRYSKTCSMCNRGLDKRDKERLVWLKSQKKQTA
jgi:radical SAM protein with 4Fe4S-binding SPASM domain